uniref:Uncharacterized protein n=1 Tax=Timema poppense TaxID=170557 RepID=A0A7R9HDK7_TIMPO|nr:unnamed protein product [Timema poppensis]
MLPMEPQNIKLKSWQLF